MGYLGALASVGKRPGASPRLPSAAVSRRVAKSDRGQYVAYLRVCRLPLRDAVPATWLHVQSFGAQLDLLTARDFPFPALGLVHLANSMTLRRRVAFEEPLAVSVRASGLRPHRAGALVDVIADVRAGTDSEPTWSGVSSYLARGVRVPGEPEAPAELVDASGLRLAGEWRLPSDLGRRYAAASGDRNPIHLSALAARAFGFPRAIAHGMWSHARALGTLAGRLPEAYRADVRFGKPVLLPGTVAVSLGEAPTGWTFALSSRDGERRHLTGVVRSL